MRRGVVVSETVDPADARAFCAVVDAGSITAAARVVGETKGSVSRRVARLERALGVALLRRSPRLVQPTEHGARYRRDAGEALELLDRAAELARGQSTEPSGRLRVTAPIDLALTLLPPLVARFVEAHPQVCVEMVASDERLDFDAQRIDCALRVGTLRDSSLRVHKVADLDVGLYASPAYLARVGAPRDPADLTTLRYVSYANLPRPAPMPFVRGGRRTTISLEPAIIGDGGFVHAVIAEGGGFGPMPRVVARAGLAAGRLVELLPEHRLAVSAPLSLLYPSSAYVPAKIRAFRDLLVDACALRREAARPRRARV